MRRDPRDRISAVCWKGDHHRCAGWMVIPHWGAAAIDEGRSVRCECEHCQHPPVQPDRHRSKVLKGARP